jgi:hypothetical protein
MRTYEKFINSFTLALLTVILIASSPLKIAEENFAQASEPAKLIIKKTIVVERTPESAQIYAHAKMDEYGWGTSVQWACLIDLWNGESRWEPNSYNREAVYLNGKALHAGGIPQILGLDPDTTVEYQIQQGFNYVKSRYGNPCSAINFWHRHFWY